MKIFRDIAQRTAKWHELRRGRVCSSAVSRIVDGDGNLKKGRSKAEPISQAVHTYVAELIAERVSGYVDTGMAYASAAMDYGQQHEAAARAAIEFETGIEFEQVGGCLSTCGRWWASGDGIQANGDTVVSTCEIKIPTPKYQVAYLLDVSRLTDEYTPQVCHEMLVAGAATGFLYSYGAGLNCDRPNVLVQINGDDPFIANLRAALESFDVLVRAACRRIGCPETLPEPVVVDEAAAARQWFDEQFGPD